ncbi:thioesterase II family protein [Peterkaempfera bronchialis]|uniref:Thioesterase n=1 Tax=Peterkaempfera bronchialis TaxID=2126346 RepID=A0A345T2A5_9ACTN|nr:alpha/beta fold hydrolase [Peterkaempfera bronchialis]AXI80110.1 thioesterase [Peterkaempfera bronchialis]
MSPFVRPRRLDDPALRLVVLHHAGGSGAAYFPLVRSLPADWDALLLDLPGRGKRHAQPPLEDMAELVARVTEDILPWADGPPLAIFGHSLGAVVAHETARALEARGASPVWVGVSGRAAPGWQGAAALPRHDLSDTELMSRLTEMGGMHPRIDELPDFRERFLDLVRRDLRAVAAYRPDPAREPLGVPLTAFGAVDDAWAPPRSLARWEQETCEEFRQRTFTGGHFYLLGPGGAAFTAELVREIRHAVRPGLADRTARVRTPV